MVTIIVIILIIFAAFVIYAYNSLTNAKNRVELALVELRKYEQEGTEEDLSNAKKYYAAVLRDYNNKVEKFPFNLVAELFNFPRMHSEDFDEGL